jgi:hypothetical protein
VSEPIAVAFVEVRPDTSEFRTNAERELSAGLDRDVEVRGRVELDGVTNARREIDSLRSGLSNIGEGQQLQFQGLDEATRDAQLLTQQLQEVSGVDVAKPVTQFQQSLAQLPSTGAFAAIGADAHGAAEGLTALGHAGEEAAGGVGHSDAAVLEANAALVEAGTSGQKFGGVMKQAGQAASSGMQAAAAATREETAATRAATIEEERFIKVRSRRATAVGAFRFAGVGLLAGSAIFGATRALGELTQSLQVTGNEALTTGGRLRNLAANVLAGDFVGAVKAMTNQTRTFNHEQLEMIAGSFELEQALRAMGRGGDIAKSRIAELGHVLEEAQPQFLATQLAEARASGNEGAVVEVLKRQGLAIEEALEEAGHLRGNVKALNREIKTRRDELVEVRAEIGRLEQEPPGAVRVTRGQVFRRSPLDNLREREEELVGQMNDFAKQRNETVPAFNLTKEAIADATRANKEAVDAAVRSTAEQTLQPLREAVTDATLADDPEAIIRALNTEAVRLRAIIAAYEGSAEDRERFKNDLISVNRAKEATQEAIVAEAERHRQAMIDNKLAPSEEAIIDAELRDASTIPARQARIAQAESILATGMINGKKISRDQRVALKNEIEAQNNAIESEQDAINAENQRHRDENQRKLDEADNAFLRDSALRQSTLRRRQAAAEDTPTPVDDISVSNALQLFYKNEIARARATLKDAAVLKETISQLRDAQLDEFLNERALRREARRNALERREEHLDINIELAQVNENRQAEIRARNARIAFLRERIESTRRGSIERRRLRLEIARERAAIRELKEEVDNNEERTEFKQMAFQFLTELRGFSSQLAGNVLTPGFTLGQQPGTSPRATPPRPKPILQPTGLGVASPFERPDQTAAAALREGEGQPATAGQMGTLISTTRTTNRLLGDIKRGIGHPESKTSRDLARHRGSTTGVA